jgi:hypothetical protein
MIPHPDIADAGEKRLHASAASSPADKPQVAIGNPSVLRTSMISSVDAGS